MVISGFSWSSSSPLLATETPLLDTETEFLQMPNTDPNEFHFLFDLCMLMQCRSNAISAFQQQNPSVVPMLTECTTLFVVIFHVFWNSPVLAQVFFTLYLELLSENLF